MASSSRDSWGKNLKDLIRTKKGRGKHIKSFDITTLSLNAGQISA